MLAFIWFLSTYKVSRVKYRVRYTDIIDAWPDLLKLLTFDLEPRFWISSDSTFIIVFIYVFIYKLIIIINMSIMTTTSQGQRIQLNDNHFIHILNQLKIFPTKTLPSQQHKFCNFTCSIRSCCKADATLLHKTQTFRSYSTVTKLAAQTLNTLVMGPNSQKGA